MTLSIPRSFLWFSAVPNTLFSSKSRFPIPIWDLWIIYGTWYWRTGWRKCTRYNVLKAKFLVVIRSVRGSGSGPPISLPWTRTGVPVLEDVVESIFSYRYAIVIVPRKIKQTRVTSQWNLSSLRRRRRRRRKRRTKNYHKHHFGQQSIELLLQRDRPEKSSWYCAVEGTIRYFSRIRPASNDRAAPKPTSLSASSLLLLLFEAF